MAIRKEGRINASRLLVGTHVWSAKSRYEILFQSTMSSAFICFVFLLGLSSMIPEATCAKGEVLIQFCTVLLSIFQYSGIISWVDIITVYHIHVPYWMGESKLSYIKISSTTFHKTKFRIIFDYQRLNFEGTLLLPRRKTIFPKSTPFC